MKSIIAAAGWLLVGGAIQLGAIPVHYPSYQDIDPYGGGGGQGIWLRPGQSVTGVFDIKTGDGDVWTVPSAFGSPVAGMQFSDIPGFVPGVSAPIISASAYFYVGGLNAGEVIDIDLASEDFLVSTGASQKSFYVFGGDISVSLLVTLNSNGELAYTVANDSGDGHYFALKAAQLQAITASVPDAGATLLLLGGAMSTLALIRQRKLA